MNRTERGMFCIEGMGDDESSELTFAHALKFLSDAAICDCSKIFHTANTRTQVINELRAWSSRHDWKYPILYLSFHGLDSGIHVQDPKGAGFDRVDLRAVSDVLKEGLGCSGTLVHFGACQTLACSHDDLRRFFSDTGASAISGYERDVRWVDSMAFELLFLHRLQRMMADVESDRGLEAEVLEEFRERLLDSRSCSGLIDLLGFQMFISEDFE